MPLTYGNWMDEFFVYMRQTLMTFAIYSFELVCASCLAYLSLRLSVVHMMLPSASLTAIHYCQSKP